jgi:hypothetical protein
MTARTMMTTTGIAAASALSLAGPVSMTAFENTSSSLV